MKPRLRVLPNRTGFPVWRPVRNGSLNNNLRKKEDMSTMTVKNPSWWTDDTESSWERTKAALKRDWDQTQHDLGAKKPDTKQNVSNTVRQATGREVLPPRGEPAHDKVEPAHRFGYGARLHYRSHYPRWNPELESELRSDWRDLYPERQSDWKEDVQAIRYGWDYERE